MTLLIINPLNTLDMTQHQLKRITFATCNTTTSYSSLFSESKKEFYLPNAKRRRLTELSHSKPITIATSVTPQTCSSIAPLNHLQTMLITRGIDRPIIPASSVKEFFKEPTEHDFSSYQDDIISAFRERDITKLKQIKEEGRSLQCCNRFGESLIHMACRRGFDDIVSFLLDEGVSLRVKDDFGRTPLVDAFWTAQPNQELVKLMILCEPSLLFISDKRGHTPLDYTRKNDWEAWVEFLSKNVESICNQIKDTKPLTKNDNICNINR